MTAPCLTKLNKRLAIETPVRDVSEGGAAVIRWRQIAVIWASVQPRSGREVVRGDGQTLQTTHDVWLRYRPDLTGAMRFRLGTRVFEIQSIRDPDETKRWLVCQTDERHA
jgi:SPP1 family predicted phage head-tail adaptor